MKLIILIVSYLLTLNIYASNFLDRLNGKTVKCEFSTYSKESIPSIIRERFKADAIYITFDSKDPSSRWGLNLPDEKDLYVIEFRLKDRSLGTFKSFFTMDINEIEFDKEGRKHIMRYESEFKTYRLEFSENIIRDRYIFIKNNELQFSCKSLFDWF